MPLIRVLFLTFLAVPFAEVVVFMGRRIGWTVLLSVATTLAGVALVARQGPGELARCRTELSRGVLPGKEIANSVMILVAAALLLTPGFLTDTAGFCLLVPPIREALGKWALKRLGTGPITLV